MKSLNLKGTQKQLDILQYAEDRELVAQDLDINLLIQMRPDEVEAFVERHLDNTQELTALLKLLVKAVAVIGQKEFPIC